jgi:hypothetical protein
MGAVDGGWTFGGDYSVDLEGLMNAEGGSLRGRFE